MGISGLLPLLKPIHKNKHLSEFAGKTIAVDAYVWLHKGVYACAPEVATGKKTTKYVEYSMHRVRLLRHHKIVPYIVFDGGPLPAKKGTESERKKRRDENLATANKLAAGGKHAQAREYYVKCVDVTTEMAYQLIKALRAEGIQYVVAPYEADAQLAYLERVGIVDGILTEDSDLLVFGCQNVLFKLDSVAATVTSISRSDFGSVTAADGGISLIGWSDVQFRAMAILSGCDYLPSIPGIGLKTAWSLLRKYKTVEKVIRAIMLEGKKEVPLDYLDSFKLVEKVFLHQRVYDPRTERLVHLIELLDGEELDGEARESVGRDLEPSLAKQVAIGDICPISLLPIVDINPAYVPRMLMPLPLLLNGGTPVTSEKSLMKHAAPKSTLHDFFHPKPRTPTPGPSAGRLAQPSAKKLMTAAGQASGKRTLSEAVEMDVSVKRRKSNENNKPREETRVVTSKFFSAPRKTSPEDGQASGSSSGTTPGMVKRNGVVEVIDLTLDEDVPESHDIVQEDGYVSPTRSSYRFETPEVSTPHRHSRMSKSGFGQEDDDDFDAELLSSPVEGPRHRGKTSKRAHEVDLDRKYSEWTINGDAIDSGDDGPDLRGRLEDVDELPGDIDCPGPGSSFASTATTSSGGPITPNHSTSLDDVEDFLEEIEDDVTRTARTGSISDGWMKRWSYNGLEIKKTPVRRTETTVMGDGGRRPSYQKRSEAKADIRSSGITPIPKKRQRTELKGRPEDEFGVGDDISDYDEKRDGQATAWPGMEGRGELR